MKVALEKEYKKFVTLEEAPLVRRFLANMKEDDFPIMDAAKMAVEVACGFGSRCVKVYEAKATFAKNQWVYNWYYDESRDFDVWIDIVAEATNGFYIVGVYLTDIHSITGDNNEEVKSHMYIRKFTEVK